MKRIRVTHLALALVLTVLLRGVGLFAQEVPQTDSDAVYVPGTNGVSNPKVISSPNPEYTDRARRKKIRGIVLLSIVVTPEGTVRDAKVTTSLDQDLDQQALKAVNQWTFHPATKDGKPVPVRISAEVSFNIR